MPQRIASGIMAKKAAPPAPALDPSGVEWYDESELLLDDRNPRFYGDEGATDQRSLLTTLWREFAVDEIALSIAANGYFRYEPLFAANEDGRLVVVEGNRRLAAVRLLRDAELRRTVGATDLPELSDDQIEEIEQLPVIVTPRDSIWQFVGFKHVNGAQPWQSFSKAQYIAWVHNEVGVELEDIARQIGDRHATVKRLYRGLMVLEQAEEAGEFDREDRYKKRFAFSHLYTGLDFAGFRSFLGLTEARDFTPRPIPPSKLKPLGELCVWLYGSKSRNLRPVVESQNPHLRNLDETLRSTDGVAALRQHLPLSISLDISRGDERLFREALIEAKRRLQDARGKLLTGYEGEADLLATAEDVSNLADSILAEMEEMSQAKRRAGRQRARRR
jgi:hypothetical protein